jgi:hypothetical protein
MSTTISEDTVWNDVWPVVEALIKATLAEDAAAARPLLAPDGQAAQALELFGLQVFDILLKTVLGRGSLGLVRAVETENGRYVHLEYAWPDPAQESNSFTAADVVAVTLTRRGAAWRVVDINPAAIDVPLTGARARGVLVSGQFVADTDKAPAEPWVLPIALYAGSLQLPLQEAALNDAVEELLLPGLQHRTYGMISILKARRLWRDFKEAAEPSLDKPAGWAAAAEFIISEQDMREATQAAVGKHYNVGLAAIVPRIKQIKKTLQIEGLDERYTDLHTTRIQYENGNDKRSAT